MKKLITLSLLCLLVSGYSFAKTTVSSPRMDEYFEILSHEMTDFAPDGAVCERVALIEIDTLYPKTNYDILNGLSYDQNRTTIGELDLVVVDKSTGMVEAIAEVKCWKSFDGALKKVKNQRMRFMTHLNRDIVISDNEGKKYPKEIFKNIKRYFSISQAGGMNYGFDFELSLDLNELMRLRGRLLDCKAERHCPRL